MFWLHRTCFSKFLLNHWKDELRSITRLQALSASVFSSLGLQSNMGVHWVGLDWPLACSSLINLVILTKTGLVSTSFKTE